jgi:transcriptional regulator with XRE-family HTH domain
MTERERIGLRIQEIRNEKKLSQKELAELSEVTPANLSRIEQGKYSPGLDVLTKIANGLNRKIDFV